MSKLNPHKKVILEAYRNGDSMYVLAKFYGVSPWGIYKQVNKWTTREDVEARLEAQETFRYEEDIKPL